MNTSRSIVEVGVAMVLKDRFSQEAGKISGSFRTMMNDMNTWNRGIQMSASNTMDFGMQLVGGMARAYKYSAGVQNEVWTASKIAGATIAEQREMLQLAKDVNSVPDCWVSVKQFSKNDTATACQDWLRSTRLGRGSIKSHVRTVKVLGMGLFAFQERIHLWKGVTH